MKKRTIFYQIGNLLHHDDCLTLLILINTLILYSIIQLLMIYFLKLLDFNPTNHKCIVFGINTQLNHLCVPVSTNTQSMSGAVSLQHIVTVYNKFDNQSCGRDG